MRKLSSDSVRLSGDAIFYTLQGEGPTLGIPALFIRLHECNLQCEWTLADGSKTLCDAWYTWKKDTPEYQSEARDIAVEKLVDEMLAEMSEHRCNRWVITGGEPLMQKLALNKVIDSLSVWEEVDFEIETNGTIMPTDLMLEYASTDPITLQFNCSPKTASSGNSYMRRFKPDVLEALNKVNTWFKFVVATEEDIREIVNKYGFLNQERIILMPEGTTPEEMAPHMAICDKAAKSYGWRVTPRLQIYAYGNARAT